MLHHHHATHLVLPATPPLVNFEKHAVRRHRDGSGCTTPAGILHLRTCGWFVCSAPGSGSLLPLPSLSTSYVVRPVCGFWIHRYGFYRHFRFHHNAPTTHTRTVISPLDFAHYGSFLPFPATALHMLPAGSAPLPLPPTISFALPTVLCALPFARITFIPTGLVGSSPLYYVTTCIPPRFSCVPTIRFSHRFYTFTTTTDSSPLYIHIYRCTFPGYLQFVRLIPYLYFLRVGLFTTGLGFRTPAGTARITFRRSYTYLRSGSLVPATTPPPFYRYLRSLLPGFVQLFFFPMPLPPRTCCALPWHAYVHYLPRCHYLPAFLVIRLRSSLRSLYLIYRTAQRIFPLPVLLPHAPPHYLLYTGLITVGLVAVQFYPTCCLFDAAVSSPPRLHTAPLPQRHCATMPTACHTHTFSCRTTRAGGAAL